MPVFRTMHRFVSAALAFALVFGALPASALEPPAGTITQHVTISGTDPALDLSGMTTETARAALLASCTVPVFSPLTVEAAGTTRSLDPADYIRLDADGMLAAALAATESTTLAQVWIPADDRIREYVDTLAAQLHTDAVNARRTIVKSRLKVIADVPGRTLDATAAVTAITDAITAQLAAGGSTQPTVVLPVAVTPARITVAGLGKTIVVVLHERWLYLYNGAKLERKYRCAIGMSSYPTPRGIFKIIKKNPRPSWGNPYSAWSKKMPARIAPGYYNPLGLRALYLNSSGIRIHGTAKTWSMGQAASHGCIRLTNHNVLDIYPRVKVGTPVYILK
jgi:lipoprotein-anchoring transpeptidase ErfK/SrfK